MNPARTLLLAALLVCVVFFPIGCGSGGGSTDTSTPEAAKNGYSELEWTQDSTIRLHPGHVAAVYLEPHDGAPHPDRPDSGGTDHDVIPLFIPAGNTFTYSLDPDDATGTIRSAVMLDASGNEVFTIDARTPSATVYLPAGTYDLRIYSGYAAQGNNEDHRIVFLNSPRTNEADGRNVKDLEADLKKLLSTKSCPGCNLSGAYLYKANLIRANLIRASLSGAYMLLASLSQADLSWADLHWADLTRADLSQADLSQADLHWANLYWVDMRRANLNDANLMETILMEADLRQAYLFGAKLNNANLRGASLSNAIMPDGSVYAGPDPYPKPFWP